MGKPFRDVGWDVTDVAWDGRYGAEIQTDITTWDYESAFEKGHFDAVWASPDCTQYSIARTTAKTPRDFEKADRLVQSRRNIIEYLQPLCWMLENPDSGYLKNRKVVGGLPDVRVDYCMYGCP